MATILRKSLVQDSPKMKIGTYIIVGILVLLVVLGYVGMGSFIQEGAFYLPAPGILYLSLRFRWSSVFGIGKNRFFVPLSV